MRRGSGPVFLSYRSVDPWLPLVVGLLSLGFCHWAFVIGLLSLGTPRPLLQRECCCPARAKQQHRCIESDRMPFGAGCEKKPARLFLSNARLFAKNWGPTPDCDSAKSCCLNQLEISNKKVDKNGFVILQLNRDQFIVSPTFFVQASKGNSDVGRKLIRGRHREG